MNGDITQQCQDLQQRINQLNARIDVREDRLDELVGNEKADLQDRIDDDLAEIREIEAQMRRLGCFAPTSISNVTIAGVEHTQATQRFPFLAYRRSDAANAPPLNTIRLIANKTTLLRVYVHTSTYGRWPAIGSVSGLLEIRPPGQPQFDPIPLGPLNGPIPPIQDVAIDRGQRDHTLNFKIPGAACQDGVEYRVRVFDANHPNQAGYTSPPWQSTLHFEFCHPLVVFAVGVHFIGPDFNGDPSNVPAPSEADIRAVLDFTKQCYPVRDIAIVGYHVLDYAGDFADTSGGGCGAGWNGLLQELRRLQGPSDILFYALVPLNVGTGATLGCSGGDGRVAAAVETSPFHASDDFVVSAHEIGHAFGRQHAPSAPSQVGAAGFDPNYPAFVGFDPGSIGEFGMDESGEVHSPSNENDFMTAALPAWISPYTYQALRGAFCPRRGVAGLGSRGSPFPLPQHLFLDFQIFRSGKVEVRPSFHYAAPPARTGASGEWTPYAVELRDSTDRVLHAERILLADPYRDLDSASLDFFKPIPFHKDTARIVFTRDTSDKGQARDILAALDVPKRPPAVKLLAPAKGQRLAGKVRVTWKGEGADKGLHYLVRYSHDARKTWRVLATLLTKNSIVVDLNSLPGGQRCYFQVLATEGIRTGGAVTGPFVVARKPRTTVIIEPASQAVFRKGAAVTFTGEAFSPDTGSAPANEMEWSSSLDGTLGTGHRVIARSLRAGLHTITLRAPDGGGGRSVRTMRVRIRAPVRRRRPRNRRRRAR